MVWSGRMGLQKKIFIYSGVSTLLLLGLLTLLSLQTVNQAIDMVLQEQVALVENIALGIDDVMGHLRTEMTSTALALGQSWQDEWADSHSEQLSLLQEQMRRHLVPSQQTEQKVTVAVVNSEGKVLWTEPYLASKINLFLANTAVIHEVAATGKIKIETEGSLLTQDGPTISLLAPIKDNRGMTNGVLIADVASLPSSSALSFFLSHQGTNYNLELVTESGLVLASTIPGQSPGSEKTHHWEIISHSAEKRQSGTEKHSPRGEKTHLVAFAPLAQLDWVVVLEEPEGKVLALPWVMGRRLLVLGGAITLVAAGLMWLVNRQIVSPLQGLEATARRFGSGELEAEIPAMGQDEIGKLAESLDTMRRQLKGSLDEIRQWNQELGQRVKERTNELEELSQQLRKRDKERGDLLSKIITSQEEERQRIARELHDEVGQLLTSLMIRFKVLETRQPEEIRQGIIELKRLTAQTLDEVHHLAFELRPSSLDDLGLITALQQYTREYFGKFGVKADFQASGFDTRRLPPQTEITLYRIIQEALTNVAKHAEAKKVSILLGIRDSSIVAIVEDDGKGFDAPRVLVSGSREQKLGLYGMQERASLIGGVLTIESAPGAGTTVFVEVPLKGDDIK